MRTQAVVKYIPSWPVEIAEMVGSKERVMVNFDKLLEDGAVIQDSWRVNGWFVFVLQNKLGIDLPISKIIANHKQQNDTDHGAATIDCQL